MTRQGTAAGTLMLWLAVGVGARTAAPGVSVQRDAGRTDAAAVRAANGRFVGTWKLVGEETRDANGLVLPPANTTNRSGDLAYDQAGYMSVAAASPERSAFAGRQPTPQEAYEVMSGYTAYWGSFAVNEAASVVTHQTFGALQTAISGLDLEHGFALSANRLTLRPPPSANGNRASQTWERVPDLPFLTSTQRKLIGFWKLILWESRTDKGDVVASSPGQTGFIVYTPSGHVLVHMMQAYRRRDVGQSPTPDETMAAYRSYTGYFGSYAVDESEQYVVHHIDATMNSGPVGTDYKRFLEFSGNRLILHPPVTRTSGGDVYTTLTWERLSD